MPGRFTSRFERALRRSTDGSVVGGRLQAKTPVTIADLANPAVVRTRDAGYEILGPGDVASLLTSAVTRRYPTPGTADAEEPKVALVELAEPDLPWRYTPAAPAGDRLRPWLVLVVGTEGGNELVVRPDGQVVIGTAVQAQHPLADSHRWAHVHSVDGHQIGRILSPRDLAAETAYVACLVSGFAADGGDAWKGVTAATVACYDHWRFRTGPQGDFPELARRLHAVDPATVGTPERPFGRASVRYVWRDPEPADRESLVLGTGGALKRIATPEDPDPADTPLDGDVADEVEDLGTRITTPDGRGVVTLPVYDLPFADPAATAAPASGGWANQLRTDPRHRGAAGIGAWAAIKWQDRITAAAAAQAGALQTAKDRVAHVALGIEASRSLWRRHVPPDPGGDPAAAAARLAVLAPALGRLTTATGTNALSEIAGRTPGLGRALFSSAGRRALRPGPARTSLVEPGAAEPGSVLLVANDCPPRADDLADIPGGRVEEDRLREAAWAAIQTLIGESDPDLATRVYDLLFGAGTPTREHVAYVLATLVPGPDGRVDPEEVEAALRSELELPMDEIAGWTGWVDELTREPPCRPLDLVRLDGAVAGAIDPTVEPPPAQVRVLGTLPGFNTIQPVEVEPELDLPLWSFVSDQAPDWMLPGVGDLEPDAVVGLSTNPPFVHALLTGANEQTTGELRWRNVPMTSRWSPLRKFWQRRVANAPAVPKHPNLDILPIKSWTDGGALGEPIHAPDGIGLEAVVVFRTTLFRRYPATVVYLYEAGDFTPPDDDTPLDPNKRQDPTFTGTIGPDVTFFGFAVAPAELGKYWVVLEEPPTGYRFYAAEQNLEVEDEPPAGTPHPDDRADVFAYYRFAVPVRVLIGPLL
jgi:hypothetical protein